MGERAGGSDAISYTKEVDQPIVEKLLIGAIEEEERMLQTDEDFDYSTYKPTPLDKVLELRLSFRRVPAIANLDAMTQLRELRLDNNRIEKLEGLGKLVNLTLLDVSFNQIRRIEGLESLSKLQDLSLYGNKVSKIEGLDGARDSLEIISLGGNSIRTMEGLLYFRPFSKLRALSIDGNPLCKNPEYRTYATAFLTQLHYLDYGFIKAEDRRAAREGGVPLEEIQRVEEAGREEEEAKIRAHARAEELGELSQHGIAAADTLFDDMFREDADWKLLSTLPGVPELQAAFRERAGELGKELIVTGRTRSLIIRNEQADFEAAHKRVLRDAELEAQELVTSFLRQQKIAFREFEANVRDWVRLSREVESDGGVTDGRALDALPAVDRSGLDALGPAAVALVDRLLELELALTTRLRRMLDACESSMQDLREAKLQTHQAFFRGMETAEREFTTDLTTVVSGILEEIGESLGTTKGDGEGSASDPPPIDPEATVDEKRLRLPADYAKVPDEAITLICNREEALQAVKNSNDHHITRMNDAEDQAEKWELARCIGTVHKARDAEIERNRARLREISALRPTCARAIIDQVDHTLDMAAATEGEEIVRDFLLPRVRPK